MTNNNALYECFCLFIIISLIITSIFRIIRRSKTKKEVVRYLTVELIREIKEAEKTAEEKIRQAQQKAKEMIKESQTKAEEIIKEAVENQIRKSKEMIAQAEAEASKEASLKMENNKKECEEIKKKALSKSEAAIKTVMERIVKINGNN